MSALSWAVGHPAGMETPPAPACPAPKHTQWNWRQRMQCPRWKGQCVQRFRDMRARTGLGTASSWVGLEGRRSDKDAAVDPAVAPQCPLPFGNYPTFLWVSTLPPLLQRKLTPPSQRGGAHRSNIDSSTRSLLAWEWTRYLVLTGETGDFAGSFGKRHCLSPSTGHGVWVWGQELLQPFCHHERKRSKATYSTMDGREEIQKKASRGVDDI